jgi:hypothetical protein
LNAYHWEARKVRTTGPTSELPSASKASFVARRDCTLVAHVDQGELIVGRIDGDDTTILGATAAGEWVDPTVAGSADVVGWVEKDPRAKGGKYWDHLRVRTWLPPDPPKTWLELDEVDVKMALSEDGERVAAVTAAGALTIWDRRTSRVIREDMLPYHSTLAPPLRFMAQSHVVVASYGQVVFVFPTEGSPWRTSPTSTEIDSLQWSQDGVLAVGISGDSTDRAPEGANPSIFGYRPWKADADPRRELVVLDGASLQVLRRVRLGQSPSAIMLSPEGSRLFVRYPDDQLELLGFDVGEDEHVLAARTGLRFIDGKIEPFPGRSP